MRKWIVKTLALMSCLPVFYNTKTVVEISNQKFITLKDVQTKSENEKIITAIKTKISKNEFIFLDVNNFENIDEIGKKVWPQLLKKIDENGLYENNKLLSYDLKNLKIENVNKIDESKLIINLSYSNIPFILELIFKKIITDDDFCETMKLYFENLPNKYLTLFNWEKSDEIFNQSKKIIINEFANKKTIKINNKNLKIDLKRTIFKSIDLKNITKKFIEVTFSYSSSQNQKIIIKLRDFVGKPDITAAINALIKFKKLNFDVDKSIDYANFWNLAPFHLWIQEINNAFKEKPFTINNRDFNVENLSLILTHEPLTPWTKFVIMNLKCTVENEEIRFKIKSNLLSSTNYDLITKNVEKMFSLFTIDGSLFLNKNKIQIKELIFEKFLTFTNDKITINDKEYQFFWKELMIEDFKLIYENDQGWIETFCVHPLINEKKFMIKIKIINYGFAFFSMIVDYLKTFNEKNRFDLENKISEENTWNDVIEIVKNFMSDYYFDKSVTNLIEWKNVYAVSLNSKLKNDNVQENEDYKTVSFSFLNFSLNKYVIFVKNIKLSNNYLIELVKKDFIFEQNTLWLNFWAPFQKKEIWSAHMLGIVEPSNLRQSTIIYEIINVDDLTGVVKVKATISKQDSTTNFEMTIKNFLTSKQIVEQIKERFKKTFDFPEHILSSNQTHYQGSLKFINFLKELLQYNYNSVKEITVVNPDKAIDSNNENYGDNIEIQIFVGSLQYTTVYFKLKSVANNEIYDFKNKLTNQETSHRNKYPDWFVGDEISTQELGIMEPEKCCTIQTKYRVDKIDFENGIVITTVLISNAAGFHNQKTIEISGFLTKKHCYQSLREWLLGFKNSENAFDVENAITKYDTWQELFNFMKQIILEKFPIIDIGKIEINHGHNNLYVKDNNEQIYKYDFWETTRWIYLDIKIDDFSFDEDVLMYFKNIDTNN